MRQPNIALKTVVHLCRPVSFPGQHHWRQYVLHNLFKRFILLSLSLRSYRWSDADMHCQYLSAPLMKPIRMTPWKPMARGVTSPSPSRKAHWVGYGFGDFVINLFRTSQVLQHIAPPVDGTGFIASSLFR